MNTFIALFRGINVGGNNILPMKELKTELEKLGLKEVQTYIQSGNVVFRSEEADASSLSETLSLTIKKSHGFEPNVMILNRDQFKKAMQNNPYPEAEPEHKTLHLWFLKEKPASPDLEGIESVKKDNERFLIRESVFYLHAPDGIGRSKLAEKAERYLGVPATARNWRTVSKIWEMVSDVS